jgi:phospholipase/carboxylesterase
VILAFGQTDRYKTSMNHLVKQGKPGGAGIVFLHGYGASASDLFPLAQELAWSGDETFYFPDAPLEIPLGPHMVGRAWFPIPLRDLQDGVDFSNVTPPGLEKAASALTTYLKSLPHEKLIIGGFSQGAMLATHAVLSNLDRFLGLMILSGTLVHAGVWKKLLAAHPNVDSASGRHKPKVFFQSHGEADQVLHFAGAQKLNELLTAGGWEGDLRAFRGGHEIPMGVIRDLKSYLRNLVSTK